MNDQLQEGRFATAWVCLFLGISLILLVLTQGCKHTIPPIDVSFWSGDSAKDGISRSQENKTLQCNDPAFDQYVCLTYTDLQKIFSTMLECKKWSVATASRSQIKQMILKNPEVMTRAIQRTSASQSLQP